MDTQTVIAVIAIIATLGAPFLTRPFSPYRSPEDRINKLLDALDKPGLSPASAAQLSEITSSEVQNLLIKWRTKSERARIAVYQCYAVIAFVAFFVVRYVIQDTPTMTPTAWLCFGAEVFSAGAAAWQTQKANQEAFRTSKAAREASTKVGMPYQFVYPGNSGLLQTFVAEDSDANRAVEKYNEVLQAHGRVRETLKVDPEPKLLKLFKKITHRIKEYETPEKQAPRKDP